MSATERNTGRLVPVEMTAELVRELVPDVSEINEYFNPNYPDGEWRELLLEAFWDKKIDRWFEFINGDWWEVKDHVRTTDFDWAELREGSGGCLIFDTCHYNGGGCLAEVLEMAMKEGAQ